MRHIDPNEPYRYICPNCGSVQVSRRGNCRDCGTKGPSVYDKRQGVLVPLSDVLAVERQAA